MLKQYQLKNYRFRLVVYVLILCVIGILVIGSAKESVQNKQILGVVGSVIIMIIVSLIDYKYILKFWPLIYLMVLGLLISVLLFGEEVNGATRWISVAGIQFQPSELCKILLICFFAAFLTKYRDYLDRWKMLGVCLILAAFPLLLIFKQPNLSTTIIVALIFITLLFIAGLSYKIIVTILAAGIPVSVVTLILLMKQVIPLEDYQYRRIMAWLQPEKYADSAYQQTNSVMAIASGQLWGKGLNNNSITSLKNGNFISEPQTDFIFAIVGEELGFVGCVIVIILLFLIVIECLLIARRAHGMAGRLICCGMAALIGFQSFVNICVATGLMPNTGVPLPFVSYGLTSVVSLFIGIGLVLNVGLQPRKYGSGDSI